MKNTMPAGKERRSTVIMRQVSIAVALLLPMLACGATFKLKYEKSGRVYGPFEVKQGAKITIGTAVFTVVECQDGDTEVRGEATTANPRAKVITIGSQRLEFVWIPPGEFMMGSARGEPREKPVHKVRITAGFWMGKFEVTQEQYGIVAGQNPSGFEENRNPVDSVSWEQAQAFCATLNRLFNGTDLSRFRVRLPTEAEWEYACGGVREDQDLTDLAWTKHNSGNQTQPVGQKQANRFGLHDMLGNLWEWCEDKFQEDYYASSPEVDPVGPQGDELYRVCRGGSWNSESKHCNPTYRSCRHPGLPNNTCGFRVVMVERP